MGVPPDPGELQRLVALADTADLALAIVGTWAEAIRVLARADADSADWDARETEREILWQTAAERFGEDALLGMLTALRADATPVLDHALRAAATRLTIADPHLGSEAIGAAQLALQHAALAFFADAPASHRFRTHLALFAVGRWPLAAIDARLHVF